METKWYHLPGQNERGLALVATEERWRKVIGHLDKQKIKDEMARKEQERARYMKEGSLEMTKNWENSIEKVRQRRLDEQLSKEEKKQAERLNRYLELRAEQQQERLQYIKEAQRKLYLLQDKPRALNGALVLSEVMYERDRQLEFNEMLREHERINDAKWASKIRKEAAEERQENEEKATARRSRNVQFAKDLIEQRDKAREKEEREMAEAMKEAAESNQRALEEMKEIHDFEVNEEIERTKKARREFAEFTAMQERLRKEMAEEDRVEDEIREVYSKAKCLIEEKKKKQLHDIQAERQKLGEEMAKRMGDEAAVVEAEEQRIMENARIAVEKRELKKLHEKKEHAEMLKQEVLQARKEYLQRKSEKEKIEAEMAKWELMNRHKASEMTDEHVEERRLAEVEKKLRYRSDLQKAMRDNGRERAYEASRAAAEFEWEKEKLKREDEEFFTYAGEVIGIARDRNRMTYPIEMVVSKYRAGINMPREKK